MVGYGINLGGRIAEKSYLIIQKAKTLPNQIVGAEGGGFIVAI